MILSLYKKGILELEKIVNIHIEKLPGDFYLATSDDIQGLVAQGRTIAETIEIARDIVKKLLEAGGDSGDISKVPKDAGIKFDYPLVVGL